MLSIFLGTVKNLIKLSCHCAGIEPSKNPNTMNVFLAGFECYTNSIIQLLTASVKGSILPSL